MASDLDAQRFRGGLAFKAHRLLYHSTLGLIVKKKRGIGPWSLSLRLKDLLGPVTRAKKKDLDELEARKLPSLRVPAQLRDLDCAPPQRPVGVGVQGFGIKD